MKESTLNLTAYGKHDLALTEIPDVVFDALPTLPKFDRVYIWGAEMTSLPDRFREFAPVLKRLVLMYVDFVKMPDVLYSCTNLEDLEFGSFLITDLGPIEKLVNLKRLVLHECKKLKALPDNVFDLPSLEVLELGFAPFKTLPPSIRNAKKLKALDLQSSKISKLPPEIAQCPIETINIRWSGLKKDAVASLLPKATIEE